MEFDEIVVKESPGLCRCCLSEGCYKDLGSEYTWMNDNEIYADMLLECFDISITQHNDGPNGPNRLICEVCITRLRDACNFKKQVLESEKKFIDMVARGEFRPKVLMYQAQMKSEGNVEEVIVEEIEYLEDETDFADDEPLKRENPTVSEITVEPLPVKGKRGRPRKNADVKTEKRIKVAKTEEKAKASKAVAKGKCTSNLHSNRFKMSLPTTLGYLMMRRNNTIESTSSSSSDEEWNTILENYNRENRKLRPRIIDYDHVINCYSDEEFKSHFRLSRNTFNYLHELIREDLVRRVPGCPTIPSRHQLMIALLKMAKTESYRSICDRFKVGRATAVRAVRRVCHALFKKASTFIQWPTGDHATEVMCGFERASGFPKTIGAIDGTHIRINAPKQNSVDYINQKGFHSIQLQLVCDHKTRITHCYVGHPGSVHDQRVFGLSEVADYLNDDDAFPEDSHILGDSAYEIHQHLLTPYRDNGHLSDKQKKYNYLQSAARVTVERCIGLLKGRMRSLLHCLPMTRVDLMAEYIVACCVIHNICILRGDEIIVITIPAPNEENNSGKKFNRNNSHEIRRNAGIRKRDVIMNSL